MNTTNTTSLKNTFYIELLGKDKILVKTYIKSRVEKATGFTLSELKKKYSEQHLFFEALKHVTTTKKALCKALELNIDNACRFKRSLEREGLLIQSKEKVFCPFTKKYLAHLLSTNPKEFERLGKTSTKQLSMFE
jgi:hypothetical protein